jgi:hypothetical protein
MTEQDKELAKQAWEGTARNPQLHVLCTTKARWSLGAVPAFHTAHAVFHVPQAHAPANLVNSAFAKDFRAREST